MGVFFGLNRMFQLKQQKLLRGFSGGEKNAEEEVVEGDRRRWFSAPVRFLLYSGS